MAVYQIENQTIRPEDATFDTLVATLHGTKIRPLCLCRNPGVAMYVAKINEHCILKRMPNSGTEHSPSCDSYEPPLELSGLGQVMGMAIQEDLSGGTLLKLDFSLSKSGHRNAPVPSGKETDSVTTKGSKLTLRGVLHYLWEEGNFNRWSAKMQNKRSWFVIRKYLLHAAESKTAKGLDFTEILYIPENFTVEQKDNITQRRQAHLMRISASDNGTRRLMIAIGEVKEIEKSRYGMKMILKHSPDFIFQLDEDLHKRLTRRFNSELSLWDTKEGTHLMMIATFGVNAVGSANIEEIALMVVDKNWIPFDDVYEHLLLEKLAIQERRFIKGLRYNMPGSHPLAVAVLTDMEPPHALYITPTGASKEFIEAQNALINESKMPSWTWDVTTGGIPEFPSIQEYINSNKSSTLPMGSESV